MRSRYRGLGCLIQSPVAFKYAVVAKLTHARVENPNALRSPWFWDELSILLCGYKAYQYPLGRYAQVKTKLMESLVWAYAASAAHDAYAVDPARIAGAFKVTRCIANVLR